MDALRREFMGLVDSMTAEQKAGFLELLLLVGCDMKCMDAAIAWMRENGPDGVHDYVRQYKQIQNANIAMPSAV